MQKKLLVAVDGGGSTTRLWVLDAEVRLLARAESGPSSVMAVGVDAAARAVADAAMRAGLTVADARERAESAAGSMDSSVVGANTGSTEASWPVPASGSSADVAVIALIMAGIDREPEASQMRKQVMSMFPGARIVLENDAVGALLGGTLGAPGILLLSGTGSICISQGPDGIAVRAGGWGYLLDDAGSGYWIGREAIRRALQAQDGRGPATALSEALARVAGVESVVELVGPIHRGVYDRPWVAGLAPIVARVADEGDPVATLILKEAADDLAALVAAVEKRSPWFENVDRVPVVAAGGMFALGPKWWLRIQRALADEVPRAHLSNWVKQPIIGAAFLAVQQYYGAIPSRIMHNLRQLRATVVEPMELPG